jgi:hypothetical protein
MNAGDVESADAGDVESADEGLLLVEIEGVRKKEIKGLRDGRGRLTREIFDTIVKNTNKHRNEVIPLVIICERPKKQKRKAPLTALI